MRTSVAGLVLLCFTAVSISQASCGSASCPLDTRSSLERTQGSVNLGYEFEYIDQDQPWISTHKARVGEIAGHHDEQRTLNRIHRILATWAPTDRLSLDLSLPIISRNHHHVHNHHGTPIPDGWDFTGLGDLNLKTRTMIYKPAQQHHPALSLILGAEFPTGKSMITNEDGDEAEPGITPGSASYDFIIGGASLQYFSVSTLSGDYALLPLFFSLTYKINGKGHDDYRIGNVLSANAGITYPVAKQVGLIGQLNFLIKEKDDQGETSEEIEKTGGEYLYVSPGVAVHLGKGWEWNTILQLPVRQRVNAIQLTSDYNLQTGVSYKFSL